MNFLQVSGPVSRSDGQLHSGSGSALHRSGCGCGNFLVFFRGHKARDTRKQSLDGRLHGRIVGPLVVEKLLERIHRVKANVDNLSAGAQLAFAQTANQIFCAVRHVRYPMQPDLRRRSLDRVHRAQEPVDLLGAGIGLQREQAMRYHLQMLFRFWNKKFQDLGGNFTVRRQGLVWNLCDRRRGRFLRSWSGGFACPAQCLLPRAPIADARQSDALAVLKKPGKQTGNAA